MSVSETSGEAAAPDDRKVSETVPPDPAEQAVLVGSTIRRIRHSRRLRLVDVAERAELSHSFLSQLERGLVRPSMVSLDRIARALGVSQVELLSSAAVSPTQTTVLPAVLRHGDGMRGAIADGEARVLTMAGGALEAIEFRGANEDPGDYFVHDVDEFAYVISGRLLMDLADAGSTALEAGDSIYYGAGTPHRFSALNWAGYHVLLVKPRLAVDISGDDCRPEVPSGAIRAKPSGRTRRPAR